MLIRSYCRHNNRGWYEVFWFMRRCEKSYFIHFQKFLGQGVWTLLILQTHLKISLWRFRGQLTWDLGVKVVQPFYTNFKFFPQTFIDFIMPSVWRVLVKSGYKLDRIAKNWDSGAIGFTIQKEMITDNMFLFEQIMVFIPQPETYC